MCIAAKDILSQNFLTAGSSRTISI